MSNLQWNLVTTFLCISILLGLLQGIPLIILGFKKSKELLVSGYIIIIVSLIGLHFLLLPSNLVYILPHYIGAIFPLLFLLGPLLNLLIETNLLGKSSFDIKYHLIPSLISFLILLPFYISPIDFKINHILNYNSGQNSLFGKVLFWFSITHLLFYLFKSIRVSLLNKKKCNILLVILSALSLIVLSEVFINLFSYIKPISSTTMDSINILFISLLLYSIGFRSFLVDNVKKRTAYSGKDFNLNLKKSILEDLNILIDRKVYLDSTITLDSLSIKSGYSRNQLSQYINQELGVSFKEWINNYRLDYFTKVLLQREDMPILDLIYESGFNSKTTLNTLFKKKYQLTPTQYKKKSKNVE